MFNVVNEISLHICYSLQVLLPLIVCPRECVVIIESIHGGVVVLHIVISAVKYTIINCFFQVIDRSKNLKVAL